jgi:acetyl-CoA carboxylase biotin carboxyl carrier protein
MEPTIKEIQEILKVFLDSELQDLRLEVGSVRLAVSKSGSLGAVALTPTASTTHAVTAPAVIATPAAAPAASTVTAATVGGAKPAHWVAVTASSVGTFYRCPAPHQPPFVEVGAKVQANDTLCLIEVMKMFTGMTSPIAGRVAEILVADATLVEHGQVLMYLEPV